jgi:Tfp pilus assembly protein PilP
MQKPAAPAATPAAPAKLAVPAPAKAGAPAAAAQKAVAPAPAKPVTPAPVAPAPAKPVAVPAKPVATPAPVKVAATPAPTPAPAAPAASGAASSNSDFVQSILEQDLEPSRDGYTYSPAGRRDPFISLSKPVTPDEDGASRPRRPGIEGFMLQETSLKGVVKTADGWMVVLEGPDRKAYFVRVGQRLHDGVLTAIDAAGLTFRQEITDPLSPAKSREVRRLLHSAQEESDK